MTDKLTAHQIAVMARLRCGDILHFSIGVNSSLFWSSDRKSPGWPSVLKLEKLGLIGRKERMPWDGVFVVVVTKDKNE